MDGQNKNLILATVLSFLVILAWYTLFPPPEPTVDTTPPPADGAQADGSVATPPAATTATTTAAAPGTVAGTAAETAEAARIEIDTPRLAGSVSLLGGRIDDLTLRDYAETLDPNSPDVRLLAPVGSDGAKPYYAVYGWRPGAGMDPALVPGPRTLWQIESGDRLTPDSPITLAWDNGAGLTFRRQIAIDAHYLFTVTQSVENRTGAAVRLAPYGIIARHGKPDSKPFYVLHEGVVGLSDGKLTEVKYKNFEDLDALPQGGLGKETEVAGNGWIGFTDKYWMTTLIPSPGQAFASWVKYAPSADIYQTETWLPAQDIADGASTSVQTMLFAGAKEWETIRAYQNDLGIEGFVDSIDWGWFYFLTKPIFIALHWLHGHIGNMGWSIIALTFLIKALVFPLARKSYISMAKMKELQPEMEALKERAGEDKTKLQKEMMELYKKNKVNPASGCLPIFLQIPIFFSLYKVIFVTIELRHAAWLGWIRDLSAPDPSSLYNLFGALPWDAPAHGTMLASIFIGLLPIVLGISMWLQQKLNPAPTDPTQAMIFAWMPWVFMFMLGNFASGLVLYWITNNTITFAQQYTIMSMHGKRPDLFDNIRQSFRRKKSEAPPPPPSKKK